MLYGFILNPVGAQLEYLGQITNLISDRDPSLLKQAKYR